MYSLTNFNKSQQSRYKFPLPQEKSFLFSVLPLPSASSDFKKKFSKVICSRIILYILYFISGSWTFCSAQCCWNSPGIPCDTDKLNLVEYLHNFLVSFVLLLSSYPFTSLMDIWIVFSFINKTVRNIHVRGVCIDIYFHFFALIL